MHFIEGAGKAPRNFTLSSKILENRIFEPLIKWKSGKTISVQEINQIDFILIINKNQIQPLIHMWDRG